MTTRRALLLQLVVLISVQTVMGSLPVFQQRVVPQSAVINSLAGYSVAITPSGLRAVVAAPAYLHYSGNEVNGSVSVYDRTDSTWKEAAKLELPNNPNTWSLGYSVGISQDGLTVVAGCPYCNSFSGSFVVFEDIGNSWNAVSLTEEDPATETYLGLGVAISQDGKTLACTTEQSDGGAVVFVKKNGVWTQQGPRLTVASLLIPSFPSIALSGNGNFLVLAAYVNYVDSIIFYKRNSSSMWYQSGPAIPSSPSGTIAEGLSMTADGVFVVSGGLGGASVYKLSVDETTYLPLQELIAPGSDDIYGYRAVAISSLGGHIIVGDPGLYANTPVPDSATTYTKGGAFIFKLLSDRASFGLVGNITMSFFNATLNDKSAFGASVAVSDHGNFLVGAYGEDAYTGAAWFFASGTCHPAYSTTLDQCNKQNKACGGNLKWVKRGCKIPGSKTRLGDGGCQCEGYCGYGCRGACNRDHQCVWATKLNTCLVKATGQPGVPILSC